MEQFLEIIGIYDLIGVLLSGMCITTASLVANSLLFHIPVDLFSEEWNALLFFVTSYFLGTIFQEIGSFFHRTILYKENRLYKSAVNHPCKMCRGLTDEEKSGIIEIVNGELGSALTINDEQLYNFCRHYISSKGKCSRPDNDHSIYALSRSLSIYFFLLAGVIIALPVWQNLHKINPTTEIYIILHAVFVN